MACVSVIIVNWNGLRFLADCFGALASQTFKDFEVIFVDNGSADVSVEFAKKAWPSIKIIENGKNLGFAEANNIGMRASEAEYVVLLNNDTKPDPRFLKFLVECAKKGGPSIGAVASKMLYFSDPSRINSAGMTALKDGAARDRGVNEPDGPAWNTEEEIFGPCAGAALYKKEALEDVKEGDGYFDSSYFAYFEDVDLAYRLRLNGWKTLYCPQAIVLHHGKGTSSTIPDFTVKYGHANRLKTVVKDLPRGLILRFLPWILFRQALEFVYCTLFPPSLSPVRSRIKVIRELRSLLAKRKRIQSHRRVNDREFSVWFKNTPIHKIFSDRISNQPVGSKRG